VRWEEAVAWVYIVAAAVTFVGVCVHCVVDARNQWSPIANMILVAPVVAMLWPLVALIAAIIFGDRLIFKLRGVEWQ
jgi:hypothetical protein